MLISKILSYRTAKGIIYENLFVYLVERYKFLRLWVIFMSALISAFPQKKNIQWNKVFLSINQTFLLEDKQPKGRQKRYKGHVILPHRPTQYNFPMNIYLDEFATRNLSFLFANATTSCFVIFQYPVFLLLRYKNIQTLMASLHLYSLYWEPAATLH